MLEENQTGLTVAIDVGDAYDIHPTDKLTVGNRLAAWALARTYGRDIVYSGPIPTGGPTSGSFQVGFRENHAGAPAANEGTWIDNVTINNATVPVNLSHIELY